MTFTPKLPILFGLTLISLVGCTTGDAPNAPSNAQKSDTAIEKIVGNAGRVKTPKEVTPSTLSEITHAAREGENSDKEIEKALEEVVTFMERIETEDLSKKDMLQLYHSGEVLKKAGPDKNAATIHEIGNWANTYLKGQLLKEEGLTVDEVLENRDELIERANEKWEELQKGN